MNNTEPSTTTSELTWFKSSHSDTEGGQCVEVAPGATVVHVRDSKAVHGPWLTISRAAWAGLVGLASSERRG